MGFLLGNWKLIAMVAAAATIFGAGWKASSWRWDARWNEAVADHQQAMADLRDELESVFLEQREVDNVRRAELSADLVALQTRNDELESLISAEPLVHPVEVIRWRTREVTADGQCEQVLANPFTNHFVRLFNESSDRFEHGMPETNPSG